MHKLASARGGAYNIFQLMMWLSSIAFSGELDMTILETYAYLLVNVDVHSVSLPTPTVFRPTEGYIMDRQVLLNRIRGVQHENLPELGIFPEANETHRAFTSRRKQVIKQNRTSIQERLLLHFLCEWPTRAPSRPSSTGTPRPDDYYNLSRATAGISEVFNIWRDNQELR